MATTSASPGSRWRTLLAAANWVWPAKFLIGAALSIVAGGGVLSFLLENATHLYALTYGFRPPVEGLPYLRTLVASANAIMLMLAAVIALMFIGVLGSIARRMTDLTALSWRWALFWSLVGTLLLSTLMYFSGRSGGPLGPYCGWPLLYCEPEPGLSIAYVAFSLAIGFPALLTMFKPAIAWMSAAAAIAAYYVWIGSNILPPDEYARLLRATGFGGGMSIEIEAHATDTGCPSLMLAGQLLLRTTEHLIVYSPAANRVDEYPMRCMARISYGGGGMSSLSYKLPPPNPPIERQQWRVRPGS